MGREASSLEELADAIHEHLAAVQPTALLPVRVPLAEALAPAWSDSFERFAAAYMHVGRHGNEHGVGHGQDGRAAMSTRADGTRRPNPVSSQETLKIGWCKHHHKTGRIC